MDTAELVAQLKGLSNPERLVVIEAAKRLIHEELAVGMDERALQDREMRDAAESLKDLYAPGGELTEWTA